MSDRDRSAPSPDSGPQAGPAIPDGGLGNAMPSWLQQPPAWKQAAAKTTRRELPLPDETPIDPRTVLEVDDLPEWLQAIARRMAAPANISEPTPDSVEESPAPVAVMVKPSVAESVPSRSAPPVAVSSAEPATRPDTTPRIERPWWTSDRVVGLLLLAVVVTLIYVVLAASGVL